MQHCYHAKDVVVLFFVIFYMCKFLRYSQYNLGWTDRGSTYLGHFGFRPEIMITI